MDNHVISHIFIYQYYLGSLIMGGLPFFVFQMKVLYSLLISIVYLAHKTHMLLVFFENWLFYPS